MARYVQQIFQCLLTALVMLTGNPAQVREPYAQIFPQTVQQINYANSSLMQPEILASAARSSLLARAVQRLIRAQLGETAARFGHDTVTEPAASTPAPFVLDNQADDNCLDSRYKGKTFCTQVLGYPELGAVKPRLRTEFAYFFKSDALFDGDDNDIDSLNNTAARFGFKEFGEEYICESRQRAIFPRKGMASDSLWYYIINDRELKQGVLTEECFGVGRPCKYMTNLPNSVVSQCKQEYVPRLMVAVGHDGRRIVEKRFMFPSACKCAVRPFIENHIFNGYIYD